MVCSQEEGPVWGLKVAPLSFSQFVYKIDFEIYMDCSVQKNMVRIPTHISTAF